MARSLTWRWPGSAGGLRSYKAPTTPANPVQGVLDTLEVAASDVGLSVNELLERVTLFVFGTTRATNAIVEDRTARTALFVTRGHPDISFCAKGVAGHRCSTTRRSTPPRTCRGR